MADVVNPQAVDSVTIDNVKTVAGSGADAQAVLNKALSHSMAILFEDAVGSASRRSHIADMAMAAAVKDLVTVDPQEAVSIAKTMTGNDLAQQLAQLLTALGSGQQGVKTAQTTPPVTP